MFKAIQTYILNKLYPLEKVTSLQAQYRVLKYAREVLKSKVHTINVDNKNRTLTLTTWYDLGHESLKQIITYDLDNFHERRGNTL